MRTHKRKHHHHSSKSERKKHKEQKSRGEDKSSHKHKRKKHHKERLPDLSDEKDAPDSEFRMPSTRSAVTVVKRPTDPKVSLLAPDLESPLLPPCVQNFTEPPAELSAVDTNDQDTVNSDDKTAKDVAKIKPTGRTHAATSSESLEEDGIEEGEILEGTGTPTGSTESKDNKVVRKLKRKPSQLTEVSKEKQSSHKLKKRKWKKEKDVCGEKTKKHKIR